MKPSEAAHGAPSDADAVPAPRRGVGLLGARLKNMFASLRERNAARVKTMPSIDLDEYRRYVAGLAAGPRPSEIFLNFVPEHGAVVIATLFSLAQSDVEILADELPTDIYAAAEVIEAAVGFARRPGAQIRVLSGLSISQDHPLLSALAAAGLSGRIAVRSPVVRPSGERFRFIVADRQHYRFEKSSDAPPAIIQFGEPVFAARLHEYFDTLAPATAV